MYSGFLVSRLLCEQGFLSSLFLLFSLSVKQISTFLADHTNFISNHPSLGIVAISLVREKRERKGANQEKRGKLKARSKSKIMTKALSVTEGAKEKEKEMKEREREREMHGSCPELKSKVQKMLNEGEVEKKAEEREKEEIKEKEKTKEKEKEKEEQAKEKKENEKEGKAKEKEKGRERESEREKEKEKEKGEREGKVLERKRTFVGSIAHLMGLTDKECSPSVNFSSLYFSVSFSSPLSRKHLYRQNHHE